MLRTVLITHSTGTATVEEWAKLDRNAPNSPVLRLTRVQLDDNSHPLGVEAVVLALERFPGLTANGGDVSDITELAQRHGLTLVMPPNVSASSRPPKMLRRIFRLRSAPTC